MKRLLLASSLLMLSGLVCAAQYQLTVGWIDGTTYLPSDTPTYEAEWRVNGGASNTISALPTPSAAATITANHGDTIEARVRNVNDTLVSAWSGWVAATAATPPTQPGDPTGISLQLIYVGE